MHVVVTGSSGFIGSAVSRALLRAGHTVTGLDLHEDTRGLWRTVRADLAEPGGWTREMNNADAVIHTAARVGDRGTPEAFQRQNVIATENVVQASAGVRRLVHVSSIVVHGLQFPDPCPEDHPMQPTGNPYTDTKIDAERVVHRAHASGEVDAAVVRLGDVYGPGSEPWTVRPVHMMRARQFVLVQTGVLSPVYVDDVVRGILLAATAPEASGETIHLSGGVGITPEAFFGAYAQMLGVRLPSISPRMARVVARVLEVGAGLLRQEPPFSRRTLEYISHPGTYSIERAAHVLGWAPEVPLAKGMARTGDWLRAEGYLREPLSTPEA